MLCPHTQIDRIYNRSPVQAKWPYLLLKHGSLHANMSWRGGAICAVDQQPDCASGLRRLVLSQPHVIVTDSDMCPSCHVHD